MRYRSIGDLLESYFLRQRHFSVPWQTSRASDTLEQCAANEPDLIILSPMLADLSGAELIASVRDQFPKVRTILFTAAIHPQILAEMMASHVHGIVAAQSPLSALLTAVEVVGSGGCYFDGVVESVLHGRKTTSDRLTPRERTVLRLVAEGRSTKEIADLLTLSVKTIEKFRERLMAKLEIHDVVRLTRYALRTGICTLN